jgi:hypothetical protein
MELATESAHLEVLCTPDNVECDESDEKAED